MAGTAHLSVEYLVVLTMWPQPNVQEMALLT